jgi:hypothetical protein
MRWTIAVFGLIGGCLLSVPTASAQSDWDQTGKGAVLCLYEIYLGVQAATRMCGWERTKSDDAMDRGIAATEAFIAKNATIPSTLDHVEELKQSAAEAKVLSKDGAAERCRRDPGNRGSSIEFMYMLRTRPPAEIDASFAEMLSLPREPVMNPCL